MTTDYQLGPLAFSLDGTNAMSDALNREFGALAPASGTPAIRYHFQDQVDVPQHTTRLSNLEFFDGGFVKHGPGLKFMVQATDSGLDVHVAKSDELIVSAAISRFKDWNYLLPHERYAKDFMYNIFDFTSQAEHLKAGASYLHASSFERDDRGVAIVAWGGIGKTTTMLKLVLEDSWRFLSDDLGLIDVEGVLHRTPKWMQIYAYNLEGEPAIRSALLDHRNVVDKASWRFKRATKGPKGVRRRVSAAELFGEDRVGDPTPLTDLFFIERATVDKITATPADVDTFAAKSAAILLQELQPFTEISAAMHSCWRSPCLPSVGELVESSKAVFEKAFAGVEPLHVLIPMSAGPGDLAGFFREQLR